MLDKKYLKIKEDKFYPRSLLTSISTKLIRTQEETAEHLL
jgi:hypothetical protein